MPARRASRVVIEPISPVVDCGRFAAKAALGEPVVVRADVFAEGHDAINVGLRWRTVNAAGKRGKWCEERMFPESNDRWCASFLPVELGRVEYEVFGWSDRPSTWQYGLLKKVEAEVDVDVELLDGKRIVERLLQRASAARPKPKDDIAKLERLADDLAEGRTETLEDPSWGLVFWLYADREPIATSGPLPVDIDPERGRFSAWYEFFPRSPVHPRTEPTTLRDAIDRLDYVADLGFDVLYLPPIHPIGVVHRKGRNNSVEAAPDDVGSPWGIADHLAVHPDLGTVGDVRKLVEACRKRGLELALDIAFNCTPDHPLGDAASRVVHHTRRRHDPVRREPAQEVPGHLPAQLRVGRLGGSLERARRDHPVLDRSGRHHLPHRQPTHQGVPVLGVGDRRRSATNTPRRSSSPRRSPAHA